MKYSIFAIALSLVSFTDASKQLLCKAQAGSVLNFLVRDKTQPINCISNSSQFEITQEQYDGLVERVEATENDVLEAKMALSTSAPNTERLDRQAIEEMINATIANMMSPMLRQMVTKSLQYDGWVTSGSYMFKLFTNRVTYAAATQRCQTFGGRLAAEVLRHPDAVRHILEAKYASSDTDGSEPWVGYDDIQTEGSWRWVDGGTRNSATTAWNGGEPNNSDGNEDCASINRASRRKLRLNDIPCSSKVHFICEINLNDVN